jgi:hypothetical protein
MLTLSLAGGSYADLAIPMAGLIIFASAVMILYALSMSSLFAAIAAAFSSGMIVFVSFTFAGFQLSHVEDIDPDINGWNQSSVHLFWSSAAVWFLSFLTIAWLVWRSGSAPNQRLQLTGDARDAL